MTQSRKEATERSRSFLLDTTLSAEAKALVAQMFVDGCIQSVTTFFRVGYPVPRESIEKCVCAAWGPAFVYATAVWEPSNCDLSTAFRAVQELVQSGEHLVAVTEAVANGHRYCVCAANHALADEFSLARFCELLGIFCEGQDQESLVRFKEAGLSYHSYVANQKGCVHGDTPKPAVQLAPLRLSQLGPLAWTPASERVVFQKKIHDCTSTHFDIRNAFLAYIHTAGAVHDGNVICSSRNWRKAAYRPAIGMMTGLVPLVQDPDRAIELDINTSLEARRQEHTTSQEILRCCRNSELFLNGAEQRGIPGCEVRAPAFPVGLEIRTGGRKNLTIELSGPFFAPAAASEFLDDFAGYTTKGTNNCVTIH